MRFRKRKKSVAFYISILPIHIIAINIKSDITFPINIAKDPGPSQ